MDHMIVFYVSIDFGIIQETIAFSGSDGILPRGPFLENPGNLLGLMSVFGDKYVLTEVNFC